MPARTTLAAVITSVLLLGACGRHGKGEGFEFAAADLPAALARAEGLAEDVQTDIDNGAWHAAESKVARLQETATSVTRTAGADRAEDTAAEASSPRGEPGGTGATEVATYRSYVDSQRARVTRQDRLGALASANGLSREHLAMSEDYRLSVPTQVSLLDIAGRDAIYAAEGGRWTAAAAAVDELRSAYRGVADHVTRAQPPLNDRLRRTLDALIGAVTRRDATEARRQATAILDDVDLIEATY